MWMMARECIPRNKKLSTMKKKKKERAKLRS